jgi:hypothetical protein
MSTRISPEPALWQLLQPSCCCCCHLYPRRYILYAEGRQDLARDLTIENITGRTPQQISDSGNGGSRMRMNDKADDIGDNLQDMARRAAAAMDEPVSSGKLSASERGYGQGGSSGSSAADGVSSALHDLDQLADELSPDSGNKW